MMFLQLLLGFVILIGGAEFLVRGGVSFAKNIGISPLVVGMTIVAIGTSAPEFIVSINAAYTGATGLAVGNVVGSNIANVLLVFGMACILSPMTKRPSALRRDGGYLAFGTIMFFVLCLREELDAFAGVLLLIGFVSFIGLSYWRNVMTPDLAVGHFEEVEELQNWPTSSLGILSAIVGGFLGLFFGAELLVRGGTEIATFFGVSEEVIGLTLFALGTSLPELAASIIAALKGHADVGIGNIVGSNLFNILGVAGAAALTAPLPVNEQIINFDIFVMLASSALLIPVLIFGWKISRMFGTLFVLTYVGYILAQTVVVSEIVG